MARENGQAVRTSQKPRTAWLSRKGCAYEQDLGSEHSSLCTLHTDLWLIPRLREERVEPLLLAKVPTSDSGGSLAGGFWDSGWSMVSLRSRRKGPKD